MTKPKSEEGEGFVQLFVTDAATGATRESDVISEEQDDANRGRVGAERTGNGLFKVVDEDEEEERTDHRTLGHQR